MVKKQEFTVPDYLQNHYIEIVKITDPFCQTYLSDEYMMFSRKMATACQKSVMIKRVLKIKQFDPKWASRSIIEDASVLVNWD